MAKNDKIQGERPAHDGRRCPTCGKKLRPHYEVTFKKVATTNALGQVGERPEQHYTGEIYLYGYDNIFCRIACAVQYAQTFWYATRKRFKVEEG